MYLKVLKTLKKGVTSTLIFQQVRLSTASQLKSYSKPISRKQTRSLQIGPLGWLLLVIPASTFALGTWQVQRKKWKEDLIVKLYKLTTSDPIKLPQNLDELCELEYRPVHVRGHFLHDKELYMGPRTLIIRGDPSTKSELMTTSSNKAQGFLVITPLKLADRNETILVNRGWVPSKCKNSTLRQKGQVEGEVDVIGIVRLHENRPQFAPQNQEGSNLWFYRDLQEMARITGASPIWIDSTNEFDHPEGPIGGQTRITLRNEHLSYVITWYGLCAATSFMWYRHFIARLKT